MSSITVPDGHRVFLYNATVDPDVSRSRGGVVLANFGALGDDPDGELATVLTAIGKALDSATAPTLVSRAPDIKGMFAPADPDVVEVRSPVLWIFHDGGVASLCGDAGRVALVLERMRWTASQQIFQAVYLVDAASAPVRAFLDRVRELDIDVRRPDGRQAEVLVEVERPEGRVVSALAGPPYDLGGAVADDIGRLPLRSPLLSRLVRELHARGDNDLRAIVDALRVRTLPLLVIVDPATRKPLIQRHGTVDVMPVYPDQLMLERAAREMQLPPRSYGIAAMEVRPLFELAAGTVPIAICAYREETPIYVVVPSDAVLAPSDRR